MAHYLTVSENHTWAHQKNSTPNPNFSVLCLTEGQGMLFLCCVCYVNDQMNTNKMFVWFSYQNYLMKCATPSSYNIQANWCRWQGPQWPKSSHQITGKSY